MQPSQQHNRFSDAGCGSARYLEASQRHFLAHVAITLVSSREHASPVARQPVEIADTISFGLSPPRWGILPGVCRCGVPEVGPSR